ncbi:hypothetical protein C8R45DRAFT_1086069 [Mycena sanguinolenta]|nr:hypothetical protein C8R45DRAFT_1086069 [Mycena sanguinolenta]
MTFGPLAFACPWNRASLLLHYSKIKELEVVVDSPIFALDQVLNMLLKPAPALEHLTLSLNIKHIVQPIGSMDDGIVTSFWEFWKGTLRLRSLTLSKCLLGPMPVVPMAGRQNHLALRTLTLDDTNNFSLCSALRMLQPFVYLDFDEHHRACRNQRRRHGTLDISYVATFTVGTELQILASLTVPNLRTLIFDKTLSKAGQENFVPLLSNLLERGTSLQSLTLSDALILDKEFSQILEYIPGLVTVELSRCSGQIQSLVRTTKGTTPLCPRLDTICLSSSKLGGKILDDGHSLLELVVARNKQPARYRPIATSGILHKLQIYRCSSSREDP